ncbi:L,D-transpeptidase family protein [Clostridium manihotivorum]|uniref:L,D-transpeptidase family protein n=1 Tax=Clostridium manihotivorum TaxID=2320868 RepID=UPI00196ADFC1|nr:L,D-transpeptidase family protein [Clostridium manihotivorum]
MRKINIGKINIQELFKRKLTGNIVIGISVVILIYLLVSIYFAGHFFFNTTINGVDVSLKAHDQVKDIIKSSVKNYKLKLIEREGFTEEIDGRAINLKYNEKSSLSSIYRSKNSFKWGLSIFKAQKYLVEDLFVYDKLSLDNRINQLNCLNKDVIEPKNVAFKYVDGSYELIKEVEGNKIDRAKFHKSVESNIIAGVKNIDLNKCPCYENPKYTLKSDKTEKTKKLLDIYVSTKVTYLLGDKTEVLDGSTINQWVSVNEDLDAILDEKAVNEYVNSLSKKYDTVGTPRKFKTSIGKTLNIGGGFYGWKLNKTAEVKALLASIKTGKKIEREPIYTQKAVTRGENDIGDTYVEINITRQYLWFYKDGKLITQGDVVTGNPNRGNATSLGIYMLNYKQKGSTLRGENYESDVTYWMPFNGNIGIHDASWRYSFGGDIYKNNGTHGCVNAPLYLAKTIFENIEPGTPIICYEEN